MAGLNGFIKLHRKMIEWGWYSDCVVKDVFIHFLMIANFKPSQYMGHDLRPGQAVFGRKQMALDLGFSEQQVRTALKKLQSTGEISIFSTNRFSIATIENWEFYQCDDLGEQPTDNQQITNNQPTDNQQITNNQPHLKNDKKYKKLRKKEDIYIYNTTDKHTKRVGDIVNLVSVCSNSDEFDPAPKEQKKRFQKPTVQEVKAYCIERKNSVDAEHFIDYYESNGWRVGKNPMKDWKAAVRTWERSEAKAGQAGGQQTHSVSRLVDMIERGVFDE